MTAKIIGQLIGGLIAVSVVAWPLRVFKICTRIPSALVAGVLCMLLAGMVGVMEPLEVVLTYGGAASLLVTVLGISAPRPGQLQAPSSPVPLASGPTTAGPFCSKCGASVAGAGVFCSSCGHRLP